MRGVHATLDDVATAIVVVRIVVGVVVIAIRVEAAEGVAEPAIVVAKATIMVAAAEAAIMIMESLREAAMEAAHCAAMEATGHAAMETTAAAKTSTKAAGVTASEAAATEAAAMATAKAAASAKAAAAKTAAVAATTAAAATSTATRQCHGRRGEADSRNCHQRDHCFTQHHHSPSERLHPAACAWTHEMAIASGKHHHFGECLRSTLCDLAELVAHLRNADIGRDHDIARNPLHRLAPLRYIRNQSREGCHHDPSHRRPH
jgi:hypothetical protein